MGRLMIFGILIAFIAAVCIGGIIFQGNEALHSREKEKEKE
jgi:hypothetical protein